MFHMHSSEIRWYADISRITLVYISYSLYYVNFEQIAAGDEPAIGFGLVKAGLHFVSC